MNKEFLRMQKLAGLITENQMNELTPKLGFTGAPEKYLIAIVAGGTSDELGNMKGISASTQEEFIQKLENIYGEDLESVGLTFYEVPNQNEMNRVTQMSEDWYTGEDESVEEELMDIAEKGIPLNQISF
jgi:hypothetical protein